ncbi:NAD(P)/FAD-dependent oxidoreductase [Aquipuribacter hungaricus]|uniref:NAD(P)/FAD-dependent oxidoreductase n=1 Tax=Aquipuribacter hungaricus TaxID=545624 RepID=A0ABV7WF37_9MICO
MEQQGYDVVVVGGGAAGLSAGLTLARARRSVLVVDGGRPRNAPAAGVHGFLTRDGMPPAELAALGTAEVRGYGGEVVEGQVDRLEHDPAAEGTGRPGFVVTTADGARVTARRLVVATGLVDGLPDVAGVAQRWGRDVLHCPYCHGYEVRDQALGIVAGGPLAVHQALLFRQWSEDVVLFLHTAALPTEEESEQLAARGVRVVEGRVASLVVADDRVTGVRLASGEVVARDAVVVGPRMTARADLLAGLGLVPEDLVMRDVVVGSVVPADPTGATAVPGVYLAGNVSDMRAQVVHAAAAGVMVGATVNADLVQEDTATAVAAARAARSPVGV